MNERNLRVLEYPKILEMLAELAVTEIGREAARNLKPSGEADLVRRWQAQTEEASTIFAYNGANILTINQTIPTSGLATVTISAETSELQCPVEELLKRLGNLDSVIRAEILAG